MVLVIVILDDDVFTTLVGLPTVVVSLLVQLNVEVLVKAGEIPDITALLDASVARPVITRAVAPPEVFAHVAAPEVAPQLYSTGTPPVLVGNVTVPVFVIVAITGAEVNVCTPVKVCAASVRAIVAEVVGKVCVVPSVPATVKEFDTVSVLPAATTILEAPSVDHTPVARLHTHELSVL